MFEIIFIETFILSAGETNSTVTLLLEHSTVIQAIEKFLVIELRG
jgi:hypothetical protein